MKKLIMFFLVLNSFLFSQEKVYNLNEIIISASRIPIQFSNLPRNILIIPAKEIIKLPVNNLNDLLKYFNSVDIRSRGNEGVQADISIRGGSFEQSLILIDGVKMIDPQTGHHNLNLPISLDNIERVEILKGNGTKVFGANAFSGAVNFITKKNYDNSINISAIGGQYGFYDLSLNVNSTLNNSFFVSRKKSDGYRFNTNFLNDMFSYSQNIISNNSFINFFFGYVDKNFAANSFYSDKFPNQYERTLTRIANIKSSYEIDNIVLSSKLFYRNNFDDYHLDFTRPDWNHNTHYSEFYGGEIQSSFKSNIGNSTIGIEYTKDKIKSSNLGNHTRFQYGLFAEHSSLKENLYSYSVGILVYKYPNIKLKIWPSFDFGYYLYENTKLFVNIGKSFRIPTYTELYYVSPANMGNPNLTYEESFNYELGAIINSKNFVIESSIFNKVGKNLIDWVRLSSNQPWKVENVISNNISGAEISLKILTKNLLKDFPVKDLMIDYTFLNTNRKSGVYESKYLIEHFRNQLIIKLNNDFVYDSNLNLSARYEDRINYPSRFLVDAQLSKSMNSFYFFIKATNLFNKYYYDFPGVILPGRWISCGIKYKLNFRDEK